MKILFLDQSGKPGGAELCLLDLVSGLDADCRVGLLEDGPFRALLEQSDIAVQVFGQQPLDVKKDSGLLKGLFSLRQIVPLIRQITAAAKRYDAIYVNTPKAVVIGALAAVASRRPLIYHLHDIISADHFSAANRKLLVGLANRVAALVIANSEASREAFIAEGGKGELVRVVYNGFNLDSYAAVNTEDASGNEAFRQKLGLEPSWKDKFIVGHFSRLSPWKGQHVLLQALAHCPDDVRVLLVGDALFGETDYVDSLHQQISDLGVEDRVQMLGFRSDIPKIMTVCDLVVHSSTAPEPFGRVIVEAMLCDRPVIAAAAGGALELVVAGKTGWLCPPNNSQRLAALITEAYHHPEMCKRMAHQAKQEAQQRFDLEHINAQISNLIAAVVSK